jgi:hypothetical protein
VNHRRKSLLVAFAALAFFISANTILIGFVEAAAPVAGDLNHDTYVDGADFSLFSQCLGGAGVTHDGSVTCEEADIDYDGDVDMLDFAVLQRCYSGTGVPGDPACACLRPKADRFVAATYNPVYSGESTYISVSLSQEGVNYQLRNNANNSTIGVPVAGTGGTIYLASDPLTAATTFNVLATNGVTGCSSTSVQLNGTVTVTVQPYVPKNKIGVHIVIGGRNGFTPFLRSCRDAGKPVAVLKCVDDFGAAWEAKVQGDSPQSLTVGRVNKVGDRDMGWLGDKVGQPPTEVAAWYYGLIKPKWLQNPWIEVWETLNEMSSDWAWQADFYIAMMDLAEADGFRLGNWGCSVGNPPESAYWDLARTCIRARAHGNHILTLHEYAFFTTFMRDEYENHGNRMVLRYRRVYEYLAQHNAVVPLVISEAGQGGGYDFVGTTPFVNDFGWYDTEMRKDPYVIGCAAWTLGNWQNANFEAALPALTAYIVTH